MIPLTVISTQRSKNRYQRLAPFDGFMEAIAEKRYLPWRRQLWSYVEEQDILEGGIGTGKNLPFYPNNLNLESVDLAPGNVRKASFSIEKGDRLGGGAIFRFIIAELY